ncbi:MAG: hypothetical protein KKB31_04690 [Nanoarchaeota archaeon]|nr:hypothetical protein [Nanoarchaeota archaeon]
MTKSNYDPILEIVRKTLPTGERHKKYRNIQPLAQGGTRNIYVAEWGPSGKKVVIKADRAPTSPRAIRHVGRGYNTERELVVASKLDEPDRHGVVRLRDYYHSDALEDLGYSGIITIEDYFPNKTLEDTVKEEGPLKIRDFERAFGGESYSEPGGILEAARYLIRDQGIFHRDLGPKNILIRRDPGNLEAKITDLTNAADVDQTVPSALPTSGTCFVADPSSMEVFTGRDGRYREETEIHAIGKNMLYALTGEEAVHYNPDTKTAINTFTGESLIGEDGYVDVKKHDAAINEALKRLPRKSKRYGSLIKRCLSLDEDKRFHSIDEVIKEFNGARKPSLFERIRKNKGNIGVGLAGLALIGTLSGYKLNRDYEEREKLAADLEQQSKYQVYSEWNSNGVELGNTLASLSLMGRKWEEKNPVFCPEDLPYMPAKPGDKIWVTLDITGAPKEDFGGMVTLDGQVYMEGYPGEKFRASVGDFNRRAVSDFGHAYNYGHWSGYIDVPKDIMEGVYTIAGEIFAGSNQDEDGEHVISGNDYVHFTNPGKMIGRKTMRLVVGNPNNKVHLQKLDISGWHNMFSMARPDSSVGTINGKLRYEVSIPEDGVCFDYEPSEWNSNAYSKNLWLPPGTDTTLKTLQVIAKDEKGRVVGRNFAPIRRKIIGNNGVCWWEHATPGPEWSERLQIFNRAIGGDSTGLREYQESLLEKTKPKKQEQVDSRKPARVFRNTQRPGLQH